MVTYCLASSMEAAGVLKAVSMVSLKISIPMVSTNATIANTDRVVPMVRQVLSSSFMPVYFPTRMVPPRVRPDTMLVMIWVTWVPVDTAATLSGVQYHPMTIRSTAP